MPISTMPPQISARLPAMPPKTLPSRSPIADISVVAVPMASAVSQMSASKNASVTPTIMESMLVATAVSSSNQREAAADISGCLSSSAEKSPSRIIFAPKAASNTKATQWSNASI